MQKSSTLLVGNQSPDAYLYDIKFFKYLTSVFENASKYDIYNK